MRLLGRSHVIEHQMITYPGRSLRRVEHKRPERWERSAQTSAPRGPQPAGEARIIFQGDVAHRTHTTAVLHVAPLRQHVCPLGTIRDAEPLEQRRLADYPRREGCPLAMDGCGTLC